MDLKKTILENIEISKRHSGGVQLLALDLGCGEGGWSIFLAKEGLLVDAIDKNSERLETFRKKVKEASLEAKIRIIEGDILKTEFQDNKYDFTLCLNVLHLVKAEERADILHKIAEATKERGQIFLIYRGQVKLPSVGLDLVSATDYEEGGEKYKFLHFMKRPFHDK